MGRERASVFDDDTDELDVSDFTPAKTLPPRPPAEQVRAVSEASKFPSRESKPAPASAVLTAPAAPALAIEKRAPRRYRTGRTTLVSLKTTPEASQAFYAIADAQGWKVGETFEQALAALERELKTKG